MKLKISTWIKITVSVLVWGIYLSIKNYFFVVLNNEMALIQMQNSISSYSGWKMWQSLWQYSTLALIIMTILFFLKEIKQIIKKIKKEEL